MIDNTSAAPMLSFFCYSENHCNIPNVQERDITVQLGFVVITLCTTHCCSSAVMFTYSAKHNHNLFNILCRKSAGESDTAYTMGADTGECTIEVVLWRKSIGCKYCMMHLYYVSGSLSVNV